MINSFQQKLSWPCQTFHHLWEKTFFPLSTLRKGVEAKHHRSRALCLLPIPLFQILDNLGSTPGPISLFWVNKVKVQSWFLSPCSFLYVNCRLSPSISHVCVCVCMLQKKMRKDENMTEESAKSSPWLINYHLNAFLPCLCPCALARVPFRMTWCSLRACRFSRTRN